MTPTAFRAGACLLLAVCLAAGAGAQSPGSDSTDLVGLWKAKKRFGPDVRGQLILQRNGTTYTADMMGAVVPVTSRDGELWFDLPDGGGGFRGKAQPGGFIRGVWFPSPPGEQGSATPVTLAPMGANRWSGQVAPVDDEQTFYLVVTRRRDGSVGALLRNPERDYGAALGVRGLVRAGARIDLLGGRNARRDTVVASGSFDSTRQVITLDFPYRGGTYDFRRDRDGQSGFYPRGRRPADYVYRMPPALDDGWVTASVTEVGIDRAGIERVVRRLADMPMDSIDAPQIHSLLIARHGKLVLEEYFHGEHLLSMSSGFFCDDNNDAAPGNENGMWEQTDRPDFYDFTLNLPMAQAPGDTAIYCSCNPNLALGMLGRAAGESPFYLFDRMVAAPMGIHRYVWAIDRARNPYGGGGMGLATRDFIKFGQLMLDGGTWHGRRLLSREFVTRATSPMFRLGSRNYGLAWWSQQYTVNGRAVRWFAALGAGGQVAMVIPELDLVIATTGGSYISRGYRYIAAELIPNLILPVVAP